jgi:hypothetical protein
MVYTPDWEPLADALKRVIAAGIEEDEAKTDLCRAIADRKINVRVKIAATDYGMGGRVFSDGNVDVPPHLRPGDLDWAQSRPFAQWQIGPMPGEHYSWVTGWVNRPLDLIELWTDHVIEVLYRGEDEGRPASTIRHETAAIVALAGHLKNNPNLTRAQAKAWCKESGLNVSGRGFQSRVWPEARAQAGLQHTAPAGRKKKSSQRSP